MHINRIKVEFKDKTGLSASELAEAILIESKWNLKILPTAFLFPG